MRYNREHVKSANTHPPGIPRFHRLRISRLPVVFIALCSLVSAKTFETIAEVRALDRSQSGLQHDATIRGVITYRYDRENGSFSIQDETGGIFIEAGDLIKRETPVEILPAGGTPGVSDLVEVRGSVSLESFSPRILARSIRIVGKGEMPVPTKVTLSELRTGKWDCDYVEIEAEIRYAENPRSESVERVAMDLVTPDGRFHGFLSDAKGADPVDLIDASVSIRGVNFFYFNRKFQPLLPILQIVDMSAVKVLERSGTATFDVPEVSLSGFQNYRPEGTRQGRIRVKGTVTHVEPGAFFCLQDNGNGITVNTRQKLDFSQGDLVEASGYPMSDGSFAGLEDSVVRKTEDSQLPPALVLNRRIWERPGNQGIKAIDLLDSRYVSMTGPLVGFDDLAGEMLVKFANDTIPVKISAGFGKVKLMRPGGIVEVRGVCKVTLAYGAPDYRYPRASSVQLLAQNPEAVTLVAEAPWWTPGRLWIALGAGTVVLCLALVWNLYLQRNVALKKAALVKADQARHRKEIEFAATLQERKRLASDIHDGVEQSLAGVAFQVETLDFHPPVDEDYRHHVDTVRRSLAKLREQLRRIVWNMNSMMDSGGDFPQAMRRMAKRTSAGTGVDVRHAVKGNRTKAGDFVANQSLFVAQELLSNALKHAAPSTVSINLDFKEEEFQVTVSDDGHGFDLAKAPAVAEGHFGIQGIRERIARMGGTVEWESGERGTTVRVAIPYD